MPAYINCIGTNKPAEASYFASGCKTGWAPHLLDHFSYVCVGWGPMVEMCKQYWLLSSYTYLALLHVFANHLKSIDYDHFQTEKKQYEKFHVMG